MSHTLRILETRNNCLTECYVAITVITRLFDNSRFCIVNKIHRMSIMSNVSCAYVYRVFRVRKDHFQIINNNMVYSEETKERRYKWRVINK